MKHWLVVFLITVCRIVYGQDTLVLNSKDCEAIFLKENLLLLAHHLQISQAEALVEQAKLWPNPSFTLDQVNLWATARQTQNEQTAPPLWGNFGKDQQFAIELEQLILTAGKRKKKIDIERLGVEKAQANFAELLQNLKLEFRYLIAELLYFQRIENAYNQQITSVSTLSLAYKNQLERGNVAKGEYVRLKALELKLLNELNALNIEKNAVQKELKTLMRLSPTTVIVLSDSRQNVDKIPKVDLQQLIEKAHTNRHDLKLATIDKNLANKWFLYERSQRIPDISLKGIYDRNGSTMLDFVGFGLTFDLPIFNRNQGNIRFAQTEIERTNLVQQHITQIIEHHVTEAYYNLLIAVDFQKNISSDYEQTLDELLQSYTTNFQQRNIGMLEFMDFMETYIENKQIILESEKHIQQRVEELNYAVGLDLNNE